MAQLKFKGGKELEKKLMELTTATAKNRTRKAAKAALVPFMKRAELLAPYDPQDANKDGHIKDNIRIGTRVKGHKKRMPVMAYSGPVGPFVGMAVQQEWGNVNHGAQPFMRPAWDSTKMKVLVTLRKELAQEVDAAVARARRK